MKVCIAEKPSVAREIAEVLGATQRMNGYIEGNGYQVTWTFGHLCPLKDPHEYEAADKKNHEYAQQDGKNCKEDFQKRLRGFHSFSPQYEG